MIKVRKLSKKSIKNPYEEESPESMGRSNFFTAIDTIGNKKEGNRSLKKAINDYYQNVIDSASEYWPNDIDKRNRAIGTFIDLVKQYYPKLDW